MKKILISGLFLGLCAIQSPALAIQGVAYDWGDIETLFNDTSYTSVVLAGASSTSISAPSGSGPLEMSNISHRNSFALDFYSAQVPQECVTLYGSGGANYVILNTTDLTITGNSYDGNWDTSYGASSYVHNNGGTVAAINNQGGTLNLDNVTVVGGVLQADGDSTIKISDYVIFTGTQGNIEAGTVKFLSSGTNSLENAGGVITKDAIVDITSGNTLRVTGGSVVLNGTGSYADTWAGKIHLSGSQNSNVQAGQGTGTLTLDNFTHNTTNGEYTQKDAGSSLILKNNASLTLSTSSLIDAGNVSINGSTLAFKNGVTTNAAAVTMVGISGGTLTIGNDESSNPSGLTLLAGSSIAIGNTVNINSGNNLNVAAGTATLSSTANWAGTIGVSGTGILNLDGFNTSGAGTNGAYSQTAGSLNLTDGSTLKLETGSNITGGTVTLDGTPGKVGNNILVTGGEIQAGANVILNMGNTITLTGALPSPSSELTFNAGDLWAGSVVNDGVGNLTLDGFTNNPLSGTLTQTGSVGVGGEVSLTSGSYLTLGSGSVVSSGYITTLGGGNTVEVAGGALSSPTNGLNVYISQGDTFKVSSGTVSLDNLRTTWLGDFILSGGDLTLSGFSHNTASGGYTQTGGTLNLTGDSDLTLASGNSISNTSGVSTVNIGVGNSTGNTLTLADASITGTTVNIGTTTAGSINNSLTVSGTGNIDESATIELNSNNDLNINGGTVTLNQGGTQGADTLAGVIDMTAGTLNADSITTYGTFNYSGGSVIIGSDTAPRLLNDVHLLGVHNLTGGDIELRKSGKLTLDAADTWNGTNIANKGGAFTLNGVPSHNTATEGKYSQTAGTTTLQNGSVLTTNLDTAGNSLSGGNVVISDTSKLNLSTTAGATVGASLSGDSTAEINKSGAGTLLLTGSNSGYNGTLNVNAGEVDFNAASGARDSYISGTTNLAAGSSLKINTNGSYVTSSSNNIDGTGTVEKTGAGEYKIYAGSNGTFDYTLSVNQGTMSIETGALTTANFNSPVSATSSILRISAADTSFNEGLTLSHGYLSILNGGFIATSPNGLLPALTVGSTVNTMNGVIASNTIAGDLNIGASGIANFLIDISPSKGTSDKYIISGDITTTNPTGMINISNFRILESSSIINNVNLKIFDQTAGGGTIAAGVSFGAIEGIIKSHHSLYTLSSLGGGEYMLNREGYNPEAFRGQVATEAAYANQLTTNNMLFDHIGLISQQLLSEEKPNVYANENPLFAPYQYSKKDGGLWYKAYGNLERLQLSQDINTQNNMWGSMVGADFPIVELKKGWKLLPTAYVGYTGAYQTYSGVNMYQNGGQGGIMGTFYKGDFITSLLANVGGYANDMNVNGAKDATGNWFAGIASKSAYNIKLPKDFILQPNMLFSYNAFGGQNWSSDSGSASMTTNMMNGLNLAPGLNLILNKKTWSVYATTQLMCNLMNGTSGTVGDVNLPTVKMASTYFQYGVGVTKRIKDRVSAYGQIVMSNGVRTGVGFQGGLQWKF